MKEIERLILRSGGRLLRVGKHKHYELDGERILLHGGTRVRDSCEKDVRSRVLKILRRRSQTQPPKKGRNP